MNKQSFSSNKNSILMAAVVLVLIIAVGAFLYFNNSSSQTPQELAGSVSQSTGSESSITATESPAMNQMEGEVMVMGSSFKFDPNQIKVKLGDTVKIRFMNTGGTHNLTIEGLNIATKTIPSGSDEVIEFTADKAGEYQFYCSVGNHREQGMAGTLVVE